MSDRQLTEQRDLVRARNRDARLSTMAEAQRLADQRRATAQRRATRDDADEM
ncbi:hypothetical protein QLQ12_25065 [Actinoplanes sp. NEAU-A12]|uniref:Uncharacterized protein n=1 Tax=Actinoplanes sandaracinus TaxID=3045177 RepID=A0ABT6WQC9_9ACTN|nr:hypothetical protein [Actinoplanes sandaracinus]MDI6101894.1 hypothetical protein [Actinoplanes sandaracinus]